MANYKNFKPLAISATQYGVTYEAPSFPAYEGYIFEYNITNISSGVRWYVAETYQDARNRVNGTEYLKKPEGNFLAVNSL